MSQPEESRAKTGSTDDILLRGAEDGARERDDALRPPEDELPEEDRRTSRTRHRPTS